jgi:hypothetical protein
MLVDSRRGLLVSGCLLVGAAVVTLLYVLPATRPEVQAMDDAVWRFARSVENPPATAVAMVLSLLGSGAVNWPLRILAMLLLAWRRHWLRLAAFALAVITSELLIGWMKAAVDRPRPPGSLIATTGAAFPSGHLHVRHGPVPRVPAGALADGHRGGGAARGRPGPGLAGAPHGPATSPGPGRPVVLTPSCHVPAPVVQ